MIYGGEKGKYSAIIAFLGAIGMTITSVLPYFLNLNNLHLTSFSFILILFLGLWFSKKSYNLLVFLNNDHAKKLMIASLIYLPLMQLIYVLDKWVNACFF